MSRITRTRVWALVTGQQLGGLSASKYSRQALFISPDCSLIAYLPMASDAVVNISSCVSGNVVTSSIGHAHDVLSVSFSPDSSLIVTSSMDNSVRVWNSASGVLIRNYDQHTNCVRAAGLSSNRQLVASSSDDKVIHVFEVETGRTIQVLEPHLQRVMEVMFTADGTHIISLDDSDRVLHMGRCHWRIGIRSLYQQRHLDAFRQLRIGWWRRTYRRGRSYGLAMGAWNSYLAGIHGIEGRMAPCEESWTHSQVGLAPTGVAQRLCSR